MMTRDAVQGFIDGWKTGTGNTDAGVTDAMVSAVTNWMRNHPIYPQTDAQIAKITSDLGTYRV